MKTLLDIANEGDILIHRLEDATRLIEQYPIILVRPAGNIDDDSLNCACVECVAHASQYKKLSILTRHAIAQGGHCFCVLTMDTTTLPQPSYVFCCLDEASYRELENRFKFQVWKNTGKPFRPDRLAS